MRSNLWVSVLKLSSPNDTWDQRRKRRDPEVFRAAPESFEKSKPVPRVAEGVRRF